MHVKKLAYANMLPRNWPLVSGQKEEYAYENVMWAHSMERMLVLSSTREMLLWLMETGPAFTLRHGSDFVFYCYLFQPFRCSLKKILLFKEVL